MDRDDQFQVTSPREIAHLLLSAQSHQALVLMRVPGRAVSGVTTVLYVDAASNTLVLDAAQEPGLNERLASGGRVVFETSIEQIRLTFETSGVALVDYDGRPALHSQLPDHASYVQRRDTFRMDIPTQQPLHCQVWLSDGRGREPLTLQVRDISSGGLALADPDQALDPTPGMSYRARLELPGMGTFDLLLRVAHHFNDPLAKGGSVRRVGCAFETLDAHAGIRIQAYVNGLQREQISRQRGL